MNTATVSDYVHLTALVLALVLAAWMGLFWIVKG